MNTTQTEVKAPEIKNFRIAEMLLQYSGEMLMKGHLKKANWATAQSHKYYKLQMAGVKQ